MSIPTAGPAPAPPSPAPSPAPAPPKANDAGETGPIADVGAAADGSALPSPPLPDALPPPLAPPTKPDRPDAAADSAPPVTLPPDDAGTIGVSTLDVAPPDLVPVVPDAGSPAPVDVAPLPRPLVAFMVGAAAAPTPVEEQMRQRLEARGLDVRYMADTAVASEASNAALVLISATVHSPSLTVGFHDLAKPIVVMKSSLFDELGMTGPVRGTDSGEDSANDLRIVNEGHPLAAGLRGLVPIVPGTVAWGRPPAGAVRIAVMGAEPTKVALFAYERAAAMIDRPAAARRVGFFATDRSGIAGRDEAESLFDAAIDWALR